MPTDINLGFATVLALPAALFLLIVPGLATLTFILTFKKEPDPGAALNLAERVFWVLTLSLFFDSWISFLLAELGLFSLAAVLILAALYSLPLLFWKRDNLRFTIYDLRKYQNDPQIQNPKSKIQNLKLDGFILILLLAAAFVLNFLAPHETIVGAQDSGVYFNAGASIARTGSIVSHDPLLPALAQAGPRVQPQFLLGMPGNADRFLFVSQQRLPGFFIMDKATGLEKGDVVPQLFHFYPAMLGLGMSLFGLWGGLWVTPFLGVMALFAVYLTTRRLFPAWQERWIAPLALLFLMLNAVQVWFSRQTLWEMLGEYLIFTAIYSFTLLSRPAPLEVQSPEALTSNLPPATPDHHPPSTIHYSPAARLGGLGVGLAMGLVCLAHAQFPFIIWPLILYFIWMRLTRRWGEPQWWMLGAFGLLALHSLLHIRIFALGYFEGVYHNPIQDVRRVLHLVIPALALGFFGLIILDAMPNRIRAFSNWLGRRWHWIALGLAVAVTCYMLYSYFIRVYDISTDQQGNYPTRYWSWASYIGAPTTVGPERNLLRLGWYFSPPGMLVAFLGLAAITARRLNARTAFFLAISLGVSYIFLDYNYTQEHYIYSMRRYVPATIPAFSIFAAYACLKALPELLDWVWRKTFGRLTQRRLTYAALGGGSNATIAFSIQSPEPKITSPEPRVQSPESEGQARTANSTPRNNFGLWTRGSGLLLALGIVLFLVWTGKTIFTLQEYGPVGSTPGVMQQMSQLAGRFGSKDILIFAGERDPDAKLATPLTYSFGIPAFNLIYAVKNDELGDLLRSWEKQGYHLKALLGPNGGRLAPTGFTLKPNGEVNISFYQFQQLSIQKPNNPQTNLLNYGIYDLVDNTTSTGNFGTQTGTGTVNSSAGWTLNMGQNDWPSLVNGFYNAESDPDGSSYRWTETDGVLRLPCIAPDGGPAHLTLTMSSGTTRPANLPPLSVKVYMSNYAYDEPTYSDPKRLQPLATFTLKPSYQDYVVDLPAGQDKLTCGKQASSLILWLTVDGGQSWIPQQQQLGDDTRRLSIKLVKVNLAAR